MSGSNEERRHRSWRVIVELQNRTKLLVLIAEELDPDPERSFFMGTIVQQRDALDHITRAKGAEEGLLDGDDDYIDSNLDKAIGHLYRGLFDISDWLCSLYRSRISKTIQLYSRDAIDASIKDYYSTVRPRVEAICCEIAKVRESKDVGKDVHGLISSVDNYNTIVDELKGYFERVNNAVPAMEERKKQAKRENRSKGVFKIIIPLFVGLMLVAASVFGTWWFTCNKK